MRVEDHPLRNNLLGSCVFTKRVEKLIDIVTYIHQAIREFLGNNGTIAAKDKKVCFYQASRPTSLPPNTRDTLYHGLPNRIKSVLLSRLQTMAVTKELSITQIKAEMDKTLQWLLPFATNTIKAHQGFGWVGE